MSKLDVITRGRDSSGRVLKATRQAWQHFDRVNEAVGGKLVVVQGAFSNAAASAGTHSKAGCLDIRTWNLTANERAIALKVSRQLMAASWYRHSGQGFDPHIHWVLIGDSPMDSLATAQIDMYRKGYNGLGWYAYKDDFSYRPKNITNYKYLEDNDMTPEEAKRLERVEAKIDKLHKRMNEAFTNERARDIAERERDKARFSRIITQLGKRADALTVQINSTEDPEQKRTLQAEKVEILSALAEDPDVDGIDNPAPDALDQ